MKLPSGTALVVALAMSALGARAQVCTHSCVEYDNGTCASRGGRNCTIKVAQCSR